MTDIPEGVTGLLECLWLCGLYEKSVSLLSTAFNYVVLKQKLKNLKSFWVKRLVSEKDSTCTILPQTFYNCQNLNRYVNASHILLSKKHIPTFYAFKDFATIFFHFAESIKVEVVCRRS